MESKQIQQITVLYTYDNDIFNSHVSFIRFSYSLPIDELIKRCKMHLYFKLNNGTTYSAVCQSQ